ncbi:PREDICTED: probable inorganic phosphate transporter 1-9 [Nicotiana attenuata]|uniref:Inorganic phosphate transporter 1-9 n=1 Tax=Nicotiana attenuata TaxID=49451 RepID=A0A1J6ITL5_NICAT|nr:PREDICTED: probable inorganic phosphate transporter 1-9 [Nicotiana attenuata]OIT03896.1 putative inorganic phosphate transporter 1-9 [Nicotiana attenuata]
MALKVLTALDSAKTQYYHFKAIIIAGMGLFTDAYDLFCIPPIMKLIGRIYYGSSKDPGQVPQAVTSAMVVTALLGTVIGQLVFGRLGDLIGRRKVYGFALMIMVLSSFGCGHSICTSRTCVLFSLGFFRFLLGIGIGGDYPLSATIMSEFANKRTRGAFIAGVFSMQGFGILASSTVTMIVCSIFDRATSGGSESTPHSADLAWRIILMIGAVPAGFTYYWRMMMPETARYTALIERNVPQAAKDMEKVLDISASQIAEEFCVYPRNSPPSYSFFSKTFIHSHGRNLFACSISWFLVDIVFYSSNLFQSQIYKRYLSKKQEVNAFQEAFEVARLQAIIAICSTIPGYFATMYFIDRFGRVKIQMMGFFFMAISLLAMGIPYYSYWNNNTNGWFMFLYGLTFFFSNFGPNTTTFIVPAELFPARFRTTCHGISGAIGKIGAIIGSVGFLWASHNKKEDGYTKGIGMTASLILLAGVCLVGMIITYFFTPETTGKSLEENENIISEYHQRNPEG